MNKKWLAALLAATCGVSCAFGLSACVNNEPPEHEHTYSESWSHDGDNHFYACTGPDCNSVKGTQAHAYGEWVTETPATTTQKGREKRECTVCGYAQFRDTDFAHAHNWGAWTVTDENKPDAASTGKATRTCSNSGCSAPAEDKEYTLPALTSDDYSKSADSATCSAAGAITYTYNKDDVNVSFNVATPVNADAHGYGGYVNTDKDGHYKVCANDGTHTTPKSEHDTDGADGACSVCGYKAAAVTHNWGNWTVSDENKPTNVLPGKATRKCTDDGCNVTDTEEIELPPLASASEYTVTDNTATCTEAGTATYTYNGNTSISFTVATTEKGHNYGEAVLIDGVPKSECGNCGDKVDAELSSTVNQSMEKAKFFAGGNLEYTLTAHSGAQGYYTFTYQGEQTVKVEYSYYSLKDGEISETVTLSGSGRTKITVFLETRATCTMKITSEEETAFGGELELEFSVTDPSYVIPTLALDITTVTATYEGIIYQFTAPVNGSYTLSCASSEAVIILDGTAELLELPYTFALAKDETVSFAMCCNDETAEYDVQVGLNMKGSGTHSDPYVITEEMLAVNVNAVLKDGETKYYKIAMKGDYLLNCLPLEAKGSYPDFISDRYTAEAYTAEIVIAEEKITVTGWRVNKIECGEDGFVFALKGSGSGVTDNVQLYVNHIYGSEANPANWLWYYFFYNTNQGFEVGETFYIDFLARVSGRVNISTLNISSIKYDGKVIATDGKSFEMIVTEGEHYYFECVISEDTDATYYIGTDVNTEVTTVAPPVGSQIGTKFQSGSILLWFNYSAGTEKNPYKLDGETSFGVYAEDKTYAQVTQSGNYTFSFSGLTATLNGETGVVSGKKYKLVANDVIEFVNESGEASVSAEFEANVGDITNPLLISELQSGSFTVEADSTYYVKAAGASDTVLTFDGVTVTCNGNPVTSGTKFAVKDGDIITVVNGGAAEVSVSYAATAVLGSVNNPKTLTAETAENVSEDTYYTLTLTGGGKYTVSVSDTTPLTVNGLNKMNMAVLPDVKYPLYSAIVEIDNKKYVFNAEGVLCTYTGYDGGISVGYNGEKKSAFVATDDSKTIELKAGTYLLHVIKNPGALSVIETMEIDCSLTVNEVQNTGNENEGSGTFEDPFKAVSGENANTTTKDDEMCNEAGAHVHYYTYTAQSAGVVTFSITGDTFVLTSKLSHKDAENFNDGEYAFAGEVASCTVNVTAGETVYILAGNGNGFGDYSFNVEFAAN